MKNKTYIPCLFILFIVLLVCSCEPKQEISENKIQFDTINVTESHHLKNDSTQPSCNLRISFIYPSDYVDNEVLESTTTKFISNFFGEPYSDLLPKEAAEKYAKSYIHNYEEDARIFFREKENDFSHDSQTDTYFSYYESLSNEIIFNKANLLSSRMRQENYKGGGSSFQQYTNHVYDLAANHILMENDIFNEGYEKSLNTIFQHKLLETNNVKQISDLENVGYFGLEEIMPNNNFLVDEKGIIYTFNKGEYSALQLDEINIFLPYEEIAFILKENSPISILTKP